MKKNKVIISVILGLFTILCFYLIGRFSYADVQPYYSVNEAKDKSIMTIGIIGDSWVAGSKLDSLMHVKMAEKGFETNVISSGHPGARSAQVYQNLFKEENKEYSSKFIVKNKPDFCIVIAGVNDSGSQIGPNNYAFHLTQIIKTLLHYGIKPVIISLPEIDVDGVIENMNIISKTRNIISAKFNNKGEIDNIRRYREILESQLLKQKLHKSVILVDFDKVCWDYSKCSDFYKNVNHLSEKGNERLCEVVANKLMETIPL